MSEGADAEPPAAGMPRAVVDRASEGIFIEVDGHFAYLNTTAVRLFGAASAGELIGRPVLDRVPSSYRANIAERMRQVRERSEAMPLVKEYCLRMDGSQFEVEGSAAPICHKRLVGTIVLFHHPAERLETGDAERRTRALLNAVIEGTTDAIYVKDRESRFLLVNRATSRMANKSPEELLGNNDTAIFAPDTAEAGMQHDRALMATRTTETREDELTLASGERLSVITTEGPVLDDRGEVIGLFGIARDITERKRAEEERAKLREQLLHSQKLETIGRLAGGVSHDFNNLLTVINGYSELLLSQLTSGDPMFDRLSEIRKAGERAAALTKQLLVLSRRQLVPSTVLDINDVVNDVARMLKRVIGEDIRLATDLSARPGRVLADAGQFQQVLINLAVNARDAMPSGGTLLIRTENVHVGEAFVQRHPDVKPGAYVLLEVSDSGIGMDNDVKAHLFEPFFTTKKPGEGTGLGLATVYSIVKQSGGSIWAYSEPGEGTTFKICLPGSEEEVAREREPEPAPSDLRGTETILVVEDHEELRKMARVVLSGFGYHVLDAGTPGEALLIAERYPGHIHLALTDVITTGMPARELAGRLKAMRPTLEFIFTSGYSEAMIAERGVLELGACFLSKPFSPKALTTKVREVLGTPRAATILVVDDMAGIRGLLRKVLTGAGYKVIEAADGKQALQQMRTSQVDLVLTDLVMPEMEGIETIRTIHTQWPELKIIAMSGELGGQFLQVAELLGANATLPKPIRPEVLLDMVRRVLP